MNLFKKSEELPEIPPAPDLPRLNYPAEKRESSSLPSLPGDVRNNFNRDVIKSAISDSSEKKVGDSVGGGAIQSPPTGFKESNFVPSTPLIKEHNQNEIPYKEEASSATPQIVFKKEIENKKEDSIFVRLDKYSSAKEDIEEIKSYLKSIGVLINDLNKIKKEEDGEIKEMEDEIEKIKERIGDIDTKIFNKI